MAKIFRNFLTKRSGRPMLSPMTMNAAIEELEQAIADAGSLSALADSWRVPPYILYDWRSGKTRCPTARYLPAIAQGMGHTTDELIGLCNSPARNGGSAASPPERETCPPTPGRRSRTSITSGS